MSERKSMATAPVTFLKWENNLCRIIVVSARESPPSDHRFSASQPESDAGSLSTNGSESDNRKYSIGYCSARNRLSISPCSSVPVDNLPENPTASDTDVAGGEEVRDKLLVRFRMGSKEKFVSKKKSGGEERGEVEGLVPTPWKLRMRKSVYKDTNEIAGMTKNGESQENLQSLPKTENLPKSLRLRGLAEAQNAGKRDKRRFSISLSREEIEEDIFVMTGSKASRRPRKRAKIIQKQLDRKAEMSQRKSMATAPVTFFKWENNLCRIIVDSARESPPSDHRFSSSEPESDAGSLSTNGSESDNRKYSIGYCSAKNRLSISPCSSVPVDNMPENPTASDTDVAGSEEVRDKLLVHFRMGSKEKSGGEERGEVEGLVPKPWNLRMKRSVYKETNEIAGMTKNGESQENLQSLPKTENLPKSLRLRGLAEAQNAGKRDKRRFSISLSREEIEEDIFVMTGSKASRRPRKRAKIIQKQLDKGFPGLCLDGLSLDSFKVPHSSTKV
ncbi:hypothetical protein HHK36_000922 [Tetracentron sinense]|uniref:Uncharacterized protein n=1 Tax=Tetracentron sinense TaxID=13715 RepID=A0A834ZWC6_TETSI|nr:hypothetical protein HHK36_000922 [Tetracentron sinense]